MFKSLEHWDRGGSELERDEMIVVVSFYFGYFWKAEEVDKSVQADTVYIFNNINMNEHNNISNII